MAHKASDIIASSDIVSSKQQFQQMVPIWNYLYNPALWSLMQGKLETKPIVIQQETTKECRCHAL